MSIRITADTKYHNTVIIRAINSDAMYAQGAHVADGAHWLSSPIGPIPGYPARVPSANKVHTRRSVTPSVNRLRALSSPTLRGVCRTARDGFCCVVTYDSNVHTWPIGHTVSTRRPIVFPRGQSIGIAAEDAHCLNTVRNDLKDAILADGFVRAYLTTALWSSTMMPEDSERSDCSYFSHGCDVDDCSLETVIGALRDCTEFQNDYNGVLERSDHPTDRDAHDFWLSRNGHGAGFFDRGTDDADTLQDAARTYGEVNLYHVGDDDSMIIYSDADIDTVDGFTSDLSTVWS